ncbi:phage tail tape measure protein, lambda family [Roseivivax halotolerans]|uniref:Phage tail tape measure protein, lambda family n=1 Tax=Roseivivax halotolerans TaxID=93684 RepID=A0A1I5W7P0_9RHOB|nr:phage tail tape measure protein [Roseivivax halotolerans]SFQ15246.1 phage tail tape measure protein, lambda family [Roseivivax halotolerans]
MTDPEKLEAEIDALDAALSGATGMAASFNAEMKRIHETFSETGGGVRRLQKALSTGLSSAIDGVILDGMSLTQALNEVAQAMIDTAYKAAIDPVADHLGGLVSAGVNSVFGQYSPFEKGAGFAQGRVMPFATGGIVTGPTTFPMRGGTGLMGEAGPEAIMPLARGPDGKLGVRAGGGGQAINITMNITTPDVQGFERSQSQIAARMARMIGQGGRNR